MQGMKGKATYIILTAIALFAAAGLLHAQNYGNIYTGQYLQKVSDSVDMMMPRKFRYAYSAIPAYTPETGIGAYGSFTAMYNSDKRRQYDSKQKLSSIAVMAGISLSGHFEASFYGTHYTPDGKNALTYLLSYSKTPKYFWGTGMGTTGKSLYDRASFRLDLQYAFQAGRNFRIRPTGGISFTAAGKFRDSLYNGYTTSDLYCTWGMETEYDTRDSEANPSQGALVRLGAKVNHNCFDRSIFGNFFLIADGYIPVWKGGILALDGYAEFNTAGIPWTYYPEAGGSFRMRAYYKGRYMDRNLISLQAEIRQCLYRRHHAALWVGNGYVFSDPGKIRPAKDALWSAGCGYRFEIVKGFRIRIDGGIGRAGNWAITVGVNEAF